MIDQSLVGVTINDRYLIIDILGEGGMGIVYKAEDLRLSNRLCAIKLLKNGVVNSTEAKRFEAELKVISRLRNPHVVQVLDTGHYEEEHLYIVMELLEGVSLIEVCEEQGCIPVRRACNVIKGILAGLSEAHESGIIHRDLKPANIFITYSRTGDEITKVLDFGIAKDLSGSGEEGLTSESVILGTPKYMTPEQFLRKATGPYTDIYAAGLIFYELIAGRPPYITDSDQIPENLMTMPNDFKIGWLHLNATPPQLPISSGLWELILRMLAKEPGDRIQFADQVIDVINDLDKRGLLTSPPADVSPPASHSGEHASAQTAQPGATKHLSPFEQPKATHQAAVEAPSEPSSEPSKALKWVTFSLVAIAFALLIKVLMPSEDGGTPKEVLQTQVTPKSLTVTLRPAKLTYEMNDLIELNATLFDQQKKDIQDPQVLAKYPVQFKTNRPYIKIEGNRALVKGTGKALITACIKLDPQAEGEPPTVCADTELMIIDSALPF